MMADYCAVRVATTGTDRMGSHGSVPALGNLGNHKLFDPNPLEQAIMVESMSELFS
jgi:hypothetical protein